MAKASGVLAALGPAALRLRRVNIFLCFVQY